jgi:hypothetical protein
VEDKKHEYVEAGNAPENFSYEHPSQAKFSALVNIFREKHDASRKDRKKSRKNLEHRQSIIERLKIFIPIPNREPIFSNRLERLKKNGLKQDRLQNLNSRFLTTIISII